jgi:putative membrane protein
MKKLIYLVAVSVSVFVFQGCNSGTKDAKENADSLNMAKDTTSDASTTGGIAVESSDAEFATKAAVGGLAEVELGKLALTKTTNPQIKEFANMMVKDHGKANEELIALAKTKNITLPTIVDEEHKKKMEDLQKLSGTDFDKGYATEMVNGHQSTLKLMQDESKDGKDAELKSFATKTAPIVQTHLTMITTISKGMK